MLMFLFLLGVLLSMGVAAFAHKKVDAAKVFILGCGGYFAAYSFVCGMLFLLELFKVMTAVVITDALLLVILLIQLALKHFKMPRIRYNWKDYIPLAIIMIAATFVCRGSIAGFYGTGQDEGLYQIRAMFYCMDKTDENIGFPEYESIAEHKYLQQAYRERIYDLIGYYTDDELMDKGTISGTLHGLGVLPALMALWGKLFGVEYMNHVLFTCYLISIANVWLICRNIKEEKKLYAHIAALLMAVSPIVLWCGLNTLTEIVLTMFITGWFVILTAAGEEGVQLLALLPLGGICVVHILSTALIPLVVIIYWGIFFIRGKKHYLITLMIALLQYALGFTMMKIRFTRYTDGNYVRIFRMTGDILNADNIMAVAWTASVICIAINFVFMIRGSRELIHSRVKLIAGSEKAQGVCRALFMAMLVLILIAFIVLLVKRRDIAVEYPKMTLFGFVYMTGFVIFPAAIATMVKKGKEILIDRRFFAMSLCFIYAIWLYCLLVMPQVWHYYYYIRYLAPFMFLPIVLAGYYAFRLPKAAQIVSAILISTLVIFQSRTLYTGSDLTYCSYRTLMDITSCIGDDDAVLINEQGYHCQRIFTFPIKALTDADVFFVRGAEIKKQMDLLDEDYDKVFLLSLDTGGLVGKHEGWKPIMRIKGEGGTLQDINETFPPYPKDRETIISPIVMMIKE